MKRVVTLHWKVDKLNSFKSDPLEFLIELGQLIAYTVHIFPSTATHLPTANISLD